MSKKAIITGITGQDGSYLAEWLLGEGYTVHGIVRRSSGLQRTRIEHLISNSSIYKVKLHLHYADINDKFSCERLFKDILPDEIYHLAGQSHVGLSFQLPEVTHRDTALSFLSLLEICRSINPSIKIYNASTSEIFGCATEYPQNEDTPTSPTSPYGCAKLYTNNLAKVYRQAYGMFVCSGILYNHESPRRGENFVTRKITRTAAEIALGQKKELVLGNIESRRDWGHAKDYVKAMWLMLQQSEPEDYVIGSGILHSVKDWLLTSFKVLNLDWQQYLVQDEKLFRPSEPKVLVADAEKARRVLKWAPEYTFEKLVEEMTLNDYNLSKNKESLSFDCV